LKIFRNANKSIFDGLVEEGFTQFLMVKVVYSGPTSFRR